MQMDIGIWVQFSDFSQGTYLVLTRAVMWSFAFTVLLMQKFVLELSVTTHFSVCRIDVRYHDVWSGKKNEH